MSASQQYIILKNDLKNQNDKSLIDPLKSKIQDSHEEMDKTTKQEMMAINGLKCIYYFYCVILLSYYF